MPFAQSRPDASASAGAAGAPQAPPDPAALALAQQLADRSRSGLEFRARYGAFDRAERAARQRWFDEYASRHPGAGVTMLPGEWGQIVDAEAQRQDEGRPKTQRIDPAIENAGEHVRTIRDALVAFLHQWDILPQPAAPSGVGQIESRGPATAPPQLPRPKSVALRASPAAPPPAAPTNLYALLKATLTGDDFKRAADLLWNNCVSDTPFPMPSRQDIEAAWETYLRAPAPTRDLQLRAFLKRWNLK